MNSSKPAGKRSAKLSSNKVRTRIPTPGLMPTGQDSRRVLVIVITILVLFRCFVWPSRTALSYNCVALTQPFVAECILDILPVHAEYPAECHPGGSTNQTPSGGFSGQKLTEMDSGNACHCFRLCFVFACKSAKVNKSVANLPETNTNGRTRSPTRNRRPTLYL